MQNMCSQKLPAIAAALLASQALGAQEPNSPQTSNDLAKETHKIPTESRIAPMRSLPSFWDGFSIGIGTNFESLSGDSSELYKPTAPGLQISAIQRLRSIFSGSLTGRMAYWEAKNSQNTMASALFPISVASHIEVAPQLPGVWGSNVVNVFQPLLILGPGEVFFTTMEERGIPDRGSTMDLGIGATFTLTFRSAIRISYTYSRTLDSGRIKSKTASIELHLGDFSKR